MSVSYHKDAKITDHDNFVKQGGGTDQDSELVAPCSSVIFYHIASPSPAFPASSGDSTFVAMTSVQDLDYSFPVSFLRHFYKNETPTS